MGIECLLEDVPIHTHTPSLCLATSPAKISRSVHGQIGIYYWAVEHVHINIQQSQHLSGKHSCPMKPRPALLGRVCLTFAGGVWTKAENVSAAMVISSSLPVSPRAPSPSRHLHAPLLSSHPEPCPKYLAALLWIATLKRNNRFICLYRSNFVLHFSSANNLPSTQRTATRQGLSNQKRGNSVA